MAPHLALSGCFSSRRALADLAVQQKVSFKSAQFYLSIPTQPELLDQRERDFSSCSKCPPNLYSLHWTYLHLPVCITLIYPCLVSNKFLMAIYQERKHPSSTILIYAIEPHIFLILSPAAAVHLIMMCLLCRQSTPFTSAIQTNKQNPAGSAYQLLAPYLPILYSLPSNGRTAAYHTFYQLPTPLLTLPIQQQRLSPYVRTLRSHPSNQGPN